ncbi:alpha-amylase family glycosyl hydrolase [Rosettibacter firmus]|uniref:alpha-amylase family glycosyl hydrolase n=1 Tax=Rosettibacter firmus TaxID=3111522 RepID=UPI00336BD5C9
MNPTLYEINIRTFLKRFGKSAKLNEISEEYWNYFIQKKFDYIWLMGIWKTNKSVIEKYCFEDYLIQSYQKALKDWNKNDVIGSPYSIDIYEVNPEIGNFDMLLELKNFLNKNNIGLILDFVPNHFSAESQLIKKYPSFFLSVDKDTFEKDSNTFFKPFEDCEKYFAHGRDPFFPAWKDTIQVNYFSKDVREYFKKILIDLKKYCDGVRCDMAMLGLNNVFKSTWAGVIEKSNSDTLTTEFWSDIISTVKKERNDFLFIAEVYWNLEKDLQQLGFDYTYDKSILDKLKSGSALDINDHLTMDKEYQYKSVRFIENHDEERAIVSLGKEKSKAAAVIISTIPGMCLFHDGQFEGKKIKLPLQLGREPEEQIQSDLKEFYDKLLDIKSYDIFKKGNWKLLSTLPSWDGNHTFTNLLAWQWNLNSENCLVVVNFSNTTSSCRIKLDVRNYPETFEIRDELNKQTYFRSSEEVYHQGLYIELKPYQAHIFFY